MSFNPQQMGGVPNPSAQGQGQPNIQAILQALMAHMHQAQNGGQGQPGQSHYTPTVSTPGQQQQGMKGQMLPNGQYQSPLGGQIGNFLQRYQNGQGQ